jgi:hypothetical protein
MPKTSDDILFTEGKGGDTDTTLSQEQAESLRATNTTINLTTTPFRPAPSRCTNIFYTNWNSYAESPKFVIYSSECNFVCLSAEHISDLGSNQDHR